MQVQTDDELHQVNNIWMGPAGVTMPFRARYISWGIGIVTTTAVFAAARMWWSLGFFTIAWSVLIGVAITRIVGKKITHQRPVVQVLVMFCKELATPRRSTVIVGGAADTRGVRVTDRLPTVTTKPSRKPQVQDGSNATKEVPHV